jgi:hypothetical protein
MYHEPYGSQGPLDRLPAVLRAALLAWAGILVLQIVNVLTVGVSLIVFYPLQGLLYVAGGALAAHFAYEDVYQRDIAQTDIVREGAGAGLVLSILSWLAYAVLIFVLGVLSLGAGWLGCLSFAFCLPGDLAVGAALGALGAWLFQRFWA